MDVFTLLLRPASSLFLSLCLYHVWLTDPLTLPLTVTVTLAVSPHKDHELDGKERQRANLHLIKHTNLRYSRMRPLQEKGGKKSALFLCRRGNAPLPPFSSSSFSPSHLFSAFTRLSVGEIMRRRSAGPTTACLAPN